MGDREPAHDNYTRAISPRSKCVGWKTYRRPHCPYLEDLCRQMDSNLHLIHIVHFMQDGLLTHYVLNVRQFLDPTFSKRIGRCGIIKWPAFSRNFFSWGILKDHVFTRRPQILVQLRPYTEKEFHKHTEIFHCISHLVLKRCCTCLDTCLDQSGIQFEYLD